MRYNPGKDEVFLRMGDEFIVGEDVRVADEVPWKERRSRVN